MAKPQIRKKQKTHQRKSREQPGRVSSFYCIPRYLCSEDSQLSILIRNRTNSFQTTLFSFISVTRSFRFVRSKLQYTICLLYTSPSPRDGLLSRMPSSA